MVYQSWPAASPESKTGRMCGCCRREEKALGAQCRRELGMENLEGDQPVVSEVPGAVDRGHAAAPEFLLEHVAIA
jgi:hypothetical protein